MAQEFWSVRCFSCHQFQVHIVRKDSKFQCKICQVKQSVKKVFCKGSSNQCRLVVQQLNVASFSRDNIEIEDAKENSSFNDAVSINDTVQSNTNGKSKWDIFLDTKETDESLSASKSSELEDCNTTNQGSSFATSPALKRAKKVPSEISQNSSLKLSGINEPFDHRPNKKLKLNKIEILNDLDDEDFNLN